MRKFDIAQDLLILAMVILTFLFDVVSVRGQVNNKRKSFSLSDNYFPTGWMGDGQFGEKNILFYENWVDTTRPDSHCIKIVYHKQKPIGWAGICWQNWLNNWGQRPGDDFSKAGYTKLTFWARGEKGGECVKFQSGCIGWNYERHRTDSFCAYPLHSSLASITIGHVFLRKSWKKYTINLKNEDLSCVVDGFCCIIDWIGNAQGCGICNHDPDYGTTYSWVIETKTGIVFSKKIIFYLDDIQLE
jgi:hypothetical protein